MTSVFAFLITLGQLMLIGTAYLYQTDSEAWRDLFTVMVVHFSPVMVFLSLLDMGVGFGGKVAYWVWIGLTYCLIKYFIIWRAMHSNDINSINVAALFMEAIYLAGSTFFIVSHNYL